MPDTSAGCATEMTALDLEENNINSIVWATGFNCNFNEDARDHLAAFLNSFQFDRMTITHQIELNDE